MIRFYGELKNGRYRGNFKFGKQRFPVDTVEVDRFHRFLVEWVDYEPNKDELELFKTMVEKKFNV